MLILNTKLETNVVKGMIRLKKGDLGIIELSVEEALQLKEDLHHAIYQAAKELKNRDIEYKKVSLKMLKSSLERYTLTWDDVIGFDFCATRMERFYPETSSEGMLLLKESMSYKDIIYGHEYERDFHWTTSEMPDIEENFLSEQLWDTDELTLEEIKNCMEDDLIQYAIEHPEFQLKWNGVTINPNYFKEKGNSIFYNFGSNTDS